MNTAKNSQQSVVSSQQSNSSILLLLKVGKGGFLKISKLRRFVMLTILALFLLQFARIKVLVGGLTGSVSVWFVKLIDLSAYSESLFASRDFTIAALVAALPILGVYLIFGRAFCGWVCPMDFLYEMVDRVKGQGARSKGQRVNPKTGYVIAIALLMTAALLEIPFFTNYISHLTNFFRLITGGVFLAFDFPVEPSVLIFSGGIILSLLVLECFFPRLWCRVLCPVGKTYGLLNKISLIRLKFLEGECGECNLCDQSCYMEVKIARHVDEPGLRDINCIYCGRCTEGCETKGRLIKISLWR